MQRYDNYKDSGIEWIGEIPEHWELKKIKHYCYVKGRVGWKGLKSSDFLQKGYSYLVTGSDFRTNKINWQDCYQIDKERYEEDSYIQLKENDLLITKDGTIGKLAIVDTLDKPACLNSGIFVVRSLNNKLNIHYLYWVLYSDVFNKFNGYTTYGSTIKHLYQNVFVDFAYNLPKKEEQTKIANYLDQKTTEIDQLISQKQQLLKLYEEEKTAIINQAVTKGINPKVKLKDSGIDWLGEIPEHWEVKKLKYIAKIQSGFAFSSRNFVTKGVQLIKISNLYQNEFHLERQPTFLPFYFLDKYSNWIIDNGDILMSMTGTLGKRDYGFAILIENIKEKYLLNQRVSKIHSIKNIDISYILHSLRSEYFLNSIFSLPSGTKQGNFSNDNIMNQSIVLTSKEEQNLIIKHIETETTKINNKVAKTKKLITLLKEYKTALISEVVTGKIKVN